MHPRSGTSIKAVIVVAYKAQATSTEKLPHGKRKNFEKTEFRTQLTFLRKEKKHQIGLSEGKKMTGFQLTNGAGNQHFVTCSGAIA